MNFKEIKELLKLVNESNLTEFKMKDGEFELSIRTKEYHKARNQPATPAQQPIVPVHYPAPAAVPQAPTPQTPQKSPTDQTPEPTPSSPADKEAGKEGNSNLIEVKSPMVGTFYRASGPDKPVYAKVGDTISAGDVVCIVEAMKLFNEIESEVSGKIVKVMVEDASPVEYDQVLFLVEPV